METVVPNIDIEYLGLFFFKDIKNAVGISQDGRGRRRWQQENGSKK